MSFAVGQLVVAVRGPDEWLPVFGEVAPLKGVIYTVRETGLFETGSVRLIEIRNTPQQYWFNGAWLVTECAFVPEGFRPVVESRIAVFKKMLAPLPQREYVPVGFDSYVIRTDLKDAVILTGEGPAELA